MGAGAAGAAGAPPPEAGFKGMVGAGAGTLGALGAPPAGFKGIVGAGAAGASSAFFSAESGACLSSSLMARSRGVLVIAVLGMSAVARCGDLRETRHGVSNPQAEK
ncbi:MAG TPA: hypothetical protein DIV54_02125 [Verrucomicrobiales bacterium]|nr:hypothetical protein [Verrucomicrobiales bacterium]